MTREEKIDWLCRLRADLNNGVLFTPWNKEFTEALNEALEQEPTTKNDLGVDCVSRQAVLDLMADYDLSMGQVVRGIHALPPVTPQFSSGLDKNSQKLEKYFGELDCISRADARSLICEIDIKHHTFGMSRKVFKDLYNGMDELPSVTPIRPKGHWIEEFNDLEGEVRFTCSSCGKYQLFGTDFCYHCGSDNREVVEE